jgi:hypothetical protein
MPITFYIKPEANLIICRHTGIVPDDEFFKYYKLMLESKMFSTTSNLLIDLRQADSSPRSPDALRQFADVVKSKLGVAGLYPKVAVVAPKDLSFGLARKYEFFADSIPWDFVVFRSVDTALAWLRAPVDLLDDLDKNAQQIIPPGDRGTDSDAS